MELWLLVEKLITRMKARIVSRINRNNITNLTIEF